jgi:DNA-binding HxlR family transcriptional regulator
MRRRRGDGCPVAGILQVLGDKWTLLVVRDLARAPRRTTELIAALHPISSRTLVERLREMEHDELVERRDLGGSPPHVEYALTARGRLLLPLIDMLRALGQQLGCNECADRKARLGEYCDTCPQRARAETQRFPARSRDDSIVLL